MANTQSVPQSGSFGDDIVQRYGADIDAQEYEAFGHDRVRDLLERHAAVGRVRKQGSAVVSVEPHEKGTVVYLVADDMSFIVDSVTNCVLDFSNKIGFVFHPTYMAHRSVEDGSLVDVRKVPLSESTPATESTAALPALGMLAAPEGARAVIESWTAVLITEELDADQRAELQQAVESVLADVRSAVEDWEPMRVQARRLAERLEQEIPSVSQRDRREAAAFLRWMDDDSFTFLGYRYYALEQENGNEILRGDVDSALGLMRRTDAASRPLSGKAAEKAREPRPLVLTTANRRSTVHRRVYLDYVGVKDFAADGSVVGEHRFIGLYTFEALRQPVTEVPVVRSKVRHVLSRMGYLATSHTGKSILRILESYPREELIQSSTDELVEIVSKISRMGEQRRTRAFVRGDAFGRFVTVMVYLPRDRYNTTVRLRVEDELKRTFAAETMDLDVWNSPTTVVRLTYRIKAGEGVDTVGVDEQALEARLTRAVRSWSEGILEVFTQERGTEKGMQHAQQWAEAFPADYRVRYEIEDALDDVRAFERLEADADSAGIGLSLDSIDRPEELDVEADGSTIAKLRLYLTDQAPLSSIMPHLEALGIRVIQERPYVVEPLGAPERYLYILTVALAPETDVERIAPLVEDAYRAVAAGRTESDALEGLVTAQGLTWHQVAIFRAYVQYLRQCGSSNSVEFAAATLLRYPAVTSALLGLFEARFDPEFAGDREQSQQDARDALATALDDVATLDADTWIRRMRDAIGATLRTNAYQGRPTVALKIATGELAFAPMPRPFREIWVDSPRVAGVHLRYGEVARGGLRWSDREEDFRTEVLGLVKAQAVKNAVIVPAGAKGGFFAKQLPDPAVDRGAWIEAGRAAYQEFIRSLLDITDNYEYAEDGSRSVIRPERVVAHDGDDPYLVVAADKGTAAFSDTANAISAERGFWLGDAFASGGSVGYDHKAMGITARGAWESAKRHFKTLGTDVQSEDFTMIGIGDMSGDVFGNGLMRTEHAKLVAAFDHRDVFIDPNPDPKVSFEERVRLYNTPRSSWQDYNRELISAGGGVFSRSAKSVSVTEQMREALGLADDVRELTPLELIRAVLMAPVDLIYNGGVGTYVKSESETNADVGDRANDAIRVNGSQLRARVVVEGGNLGFTQAGRIEAAQKAGTVNNTDAIDNSGGVESSDREVNIKILMDAAVRDGRLAFDDRPALLAEMTDNVADAVLSTNKAQNVLLAVERGVASEFAPAYERLMSFLEETVDLDRALEDLPSSDEFKLRRQSGAGLTTPEAAVVVAYTKMQLIDALVDSDLPEDPAMQKVLEAYFPPQLVERFPDALAAHPLRREIIATMVANRIVNIGGVTYAFRAMEETGADAARLARAFLAMDEVFGIAQHVEAIAQLPAGIDYELWLQLHVDSRRLLDRATRWVLEHESLDASVDEILAKFAEPVARLREGLADMLCGVDAERARAWFERDVEAGLPEELARRHSLDFESYTLLDITQLASASEFSAQEAAEIYYAVYDRYGIDDLLTQISDLPRSSRWEALARSSLRDDLYAAVLGLTQAVLEAPKDVDAGAADADAAGDLSAAQVRVVAWEQRDAARIERAHEQLDAVREVGGGQMAPLLVATRTMRSMVGR